MTRFSASRSMPMSTRKFDEREFVYRKGKRVLEIDDQAKEIVREIGTAINESVENSTKVAEAIERLRDAGYEMELTLRLEIGLRPHSDETDEREAPLDLTEEDVQILQRMKIRIDSEEKS